MNRLLYHTILPEDHLRYTPIEEVLKTGISSSTNSNDWYSKGGTVKPEVTEKYRRHDAPEWLDFKKAIGVDLHPKGASFYFPVFTEKIVVFNFELSMLIYDQAFYDDSRFTFEEAENFDTGIPLETLIERYWDSMVTLDEYLLRRPYPKPEVLVFEPVPNEIIQFQT